MMLAPCHPRLGWERHHDALGGHHLIGHGLSVGPCRHDHLDRAGTTGAEAVGDHVVALTGLFVFRQHGDPGHPGLQTEQRQGECDEHDDGADGDHDLVGLDPIGETGEELAVVVTRLVPWQCELVDARAEQCREQRERREQHEGDRQHHARRHRTERRDRHEQDRGEADQDRDAGEQHGLAGGVHRDAGGVLRIVRMSVQRRSVAGDDEERVVDAQCEGEHHGEVQRPDREVGHLGDAVEHTHRCEQTGRGEQQRKARSGERAERDHEDDGGDRPGQQLGLHHALAVDGIEVVPEGR